MTSENLFLEQERLIDGTPIVVRHWRRSGKGHLDFPQAAVGYGAAKKETFYGYRLICCTLLDGTPTDGALQPTNADEREGALDILSDYRGLCCLGDKGFLDQNKQSYLWEERDIELLTPCRKNQKQQHPKGWDLYLNQKRRVIETTFAQAKEQFGLEHSRARTWGEC